MSKQTFDHVGLSPALLATLDSMNYTHMTPIQALSLPAILNQRDVIGQGKTGSGKTAAFGLGVLSNLNVKRFRVQSLVLCPTRELADQVAKEIRTLGRGIHNIKVLTLCGGMPMGPQIGSLEHGAHILVGTPGRILDHLEKGRIDLSELNTLVLDEADRMLDMGFQDALDAIIDAAPKKRQTLLFSATFPEKIEQIAQRIMQSPEMIKVESTHDTSSIAQYFYKVEGSEARDEALANLLLTYQPESAVVFCNTKKEVQSVADELHHRGFSVIDLHGDLEQRERDQALVQFANKSVSILVATDVAARGLDVDNLDAVFNFELSRDPEVHVHRIGRTGRAGSKGLAFSFFGEKDGLRVARIEEYLDMDILPATLPEKSKQQPYQAKMVTINIDGGKKQKVRPGDILGCLTGKNGIPGAQVGKIHLFPMRAYVAVEKSAAKKALQTISTGKMKGRQFRARLLK
ncbi:MULTISPECIES: ATP-dependent RNA helicase DbpA [Vibrio]|uniref:ATP-dependent RNA helicase DbpA n=1 Tax=Vibrio natriegens NBRC 15636 = ATCC 14048 = DSM 759 TaxID=1219067 RepID=A0AAN1CVH4_VIBNA|nr:MULTISPECIES: ATP-dependent RNA helicase DbpA [Vibrio]ALR16624.1 DEAD/DEAH box helicase [Vibrio natriegens NBRC 15636 = ATCC 14048 = DSM 759]ANQ11510.1 ATP-dependent RNA helicase DbpA [Vibrio natriegens NBRC 15636 = ATCC 14048 = DSM 759]ANQ20455.1 ATP-dependent RNA helicase DbpA [Vibrio natriegens]AXT69751.1 ATP-dependent RNA helicase DbpA [Vibrio sp. dhg]EPM39063.1 DEAD/DEAH box helicase [Vibrio natriegens NBRC 15636 = ATCC 14048 = DSM 759]